MILIFFIQFHKITAPAPDSDDQVMIFFRVLLGIQHGITVYGIDLHLMASHINEGLDQRCHFGNALLTAEQRIMQFNGERASVNGMLQTRTGKGFDNGNRPLAVDKQTGRVITGEAFSWRSRYRP